MMQKTLILMQGIPGSGKSTYAKFVKNDSADVAVFSTDAYWGEDYEFNVMDLWKAHHWNQVRVATSMKAAMPVIVVDNCNITNKDARSYFDLAKEYDYTVVVMRIECPLEVALQRNSQRKENRRVPDHTIKRMFENMEVLKSA